MIKAIALDLDDTLLDTTGLLVSKASREAFQHLINFGLKLSLDECEKFRIDLIKHMTHRDVFEKLSVTYGDLNTQLQTQKAIELFYNPKLPSVLPLLPGARENINYLKNKYKLYLVTAGNLQAQLNKAKALGIENDFIKIFVINSVIKEKKKNAFIEIIQTNQIKNQELLCIGNSLSSEINDAIEIQAKSCYFEYGEERGESSIHLIKQVNFHIKAHAELIGTCRL